jgi:hypothetical protein
MPTLTIVGSPCAASSPWNTTIATSATIRAEPPRTCSAHDTPPRDLGTASPRRPRLVQPAVGEP